MSPMFVIPRARENPLLLDDAPPGSSAKYHPSGWMQSDIFLSWFKSFIQFSRPSTEKQVLLILDGQAILTKSLELIDMAHANHISLLCLPLPIVRTVCSLARCNLHGTSQHLLSTRSSPVAGYASRQASDNSSSCQTLWQSAFLKAAVMQTATNGFRQTGIYSLNRNIFPEHIFEPSLTPDRPTYA